LVRLAIGTRGWYDDVAETQSLGIATAALPWAGHANAVLFGSVVVVVVVVVVELVVVATGTVVVVVVEVVVELGVVVVVVAVVVVVVVGGGVTDAHELAIVVVVVVARFGVLCAAEIDVDVDATTSVLSPTERSVQRSNQWCLR
jgi:hypothetical protein